MKNLCTYLYGIAKYTIPEHITEGKEYAIFKIATPKLGEVVTIIFDNGQLGKVCATAFNFITKKED